MPELDETLEQAQELWESYAEAIRRDDQVALALDRLATAAALLRDKMRAARMDRICRVCGEHNAGGCCGASVARQVDPWLLVGNRLLGAHAAPQHADFTTCCFLGPRGCVLAIKPFLCVKYDCRELLASVDPRRLAEVRDAREALLDAWLAVESRLKELCGSDS